MSLNQFTAIVAVLTGLGGAYMVNLVWPRVSAIRARQQHEREERAERIRAGRLARLAELPERQVLVIYRVGVGLVAVAVALVVAVVRP